MTSRRIRWFLGDPDVAVPREAASHRQVECIIDAGSGGRFARPQRQRSVASSVWQGRALAANDVTRRHPHSCATLYETMVYERKCEFQPVDTKGSADRIADGEKVWNSERFGALFHFRERHCGEASLRDGVWVETRLGERSRPSLSSIPPAEEAVTERSQASTRGVTRHRSMNALLLACDSATCVWLPISKGGMALAVSPGRVSTSQSRQALNEERAQV